MKPQGICKTKAILADLGISTHIPTYSGINQAYSEPYVTLGYSQPWYIKNTGMFRTRDIFSILGYSDPCQTSTMECFEKQLTAMISFAS